MEDSYTQPTYEADRVLASVLDASDDAIIGVDRSGAVFSWNRGAERVYGYSAADMIGRSLADLMPKDSGNSIHPCCQAT